MLTHNRTRLEKREMNNPSNDRPEDAPLNPALKITTDTVYQTETSTPAPLETTNAHPDQGGGWPIIWLVVTVGGIALALYFLL